MRRIASDERQRRTTVTPSRPVFSCMMGSDGPRLEGDNGPTAFLSLVNDTTASPSSRRLAFDPAALRMRPTRLPPRAANGARQAPDARDQSAFDGFFGDEPHRPAGAALRRIAAHHRDDALALLDRE